MNGTADRVGANVLKRYIGWPVEMLKEYDAMSYNFPGHEERMRNHAHCYTHAIHKEMVELIQETCGETRPGLVTIRVRKNRAHQDFFDGFGKQLGCEIAGVKCILQADEVMARFSRSQIAKARKTRREVADGTREHPLVTKAKREAKEKAKNQKPKERKSKKSLLVITYSIKEKS